MIFTWCFVLSGLTILGMVHEFMIPIAINHQNVYITKHLFFPTYLGILNAEVQIFCL